MPKLIIPVDNTDSTVTRNVVKSVLQQLMFGTEMPEIKDIIYIQRGGLNAMSQTNTEGEALKLDVEDHLQVEYKETKDQQFDPTKYQFEFPPIFKNSALGVSVHPLHSRMQLEMTITYKSKSYAALTSWLNAFNRRLIQAEAMDYHDVFYNYTVPTDVLAYLQQVYTLTEKVAPYNITLHEFLNAHFCKNGVVVRQNSNGSEAAVAINVKNTGCLGLYTQLPEVQETTKEPPQSTISFTYTVTYDRVTAVSLNYQLYIHNQVIDLMYLRKYADRRLHSTRHGGNLTFTQSVNQATENSYGISDYPDDGTQTGDGWRPDNNPPSTYTSLILPIQLDLTNLTDVLDLNYLIDYGYPSWLISIMKQYSAFLTTFKAWVIHIELFEVNEKTIQIPVTVDSNFHLISQVTLNPRNRYYVRALVLTDLLKIDFSALQKDPAALLALLQWLNPNVTLNVIGNGSYVTSDSLWAALNLINNSDLKLWNGLTVESSNIIVRRKS